MKLVIVGSGYVGLVTGACFAASGNSVVCLDIDEAKVARLRRGEIPIYEPGLAELIQKNVAAGRLSFTTDYAAALPGADFVFLAVGTPSNDEGRADLKYLNAAADQLAPHLAPETLVVIKSTVPVGTNAGLANRLQARTGRAVTVASNPEFLKEGVAISDFQFPDRVVVGVRHPSQADRLRDLYAPFVRGGKPFFVMSPESAELTKYAANAMLAARISFINEIANICQAAGADVMQVAEAVGCDNRIGKKFLYPGVGYGGSCFPKDVRELAGMARQLGVEPRLISAIDEVNDAQKLILLAALKLNFGTLRGVPLAVWGLAFKPDTDDIREAPAIVMIEHLLQEGATLRVHDPAAMGNVRREFGDRLVYCDNPADACDGARALVIMTNWTEFYQPDLAALKSRMREPAIFDGRNVLDPRIVREAGFQYFSIGR